MSTHLSTNLSTHTLSVQYSYRYANNPLHILCAYIINGHLFCISPVIHISTHDPETYMSYSVDDLKF